jgi:hypothetical protein
MLLAAIFLSPVLVAVVAVLFVAYAKASGLQKPSVGRLVNRSLLYAVLGAVASLVLLTLWIVWYEKTTGYSAGNAPLGWIFVYGPLSAAFGQIFALIQWWFRSKSLPV